MEVGRGRAGGGALGEPAVSNPHPVLISIDFYADARFDGGEIDDVSAEWVPPRDVFVGLRAAQKLDHLARGIDANDVGRTMASAPGVQEVHDLHIWTITSGFASLSAHVLVAPGADCHAIRPRLERLLAERFALTHTTLQVEHAEPSRLLTIE